MKRVSFLIAFFCYSLLAGTPCMSQEVSLSPEEFRIYALGKKKALMQDLKELQRQMRYIKEDRSLARERAIEDLKLTTEYMKSGGDPRKFDEDEKESKKRQEALADKAEAMNDKIKAVQAKLLDLELVVKAKNGGTLPEWWEDDTKAKSGQ